MNKSLLLLMIFFSSLAFSIDALKIEAGFTLSQDFRAISGKMEHWLLELMPDGTFKFDSSHHKGSQDFCSEEGGVYSMDIGPQIHSKLVEMAVKARQEQEAKAIKKIGLDSKKIVKPNLAYVSLHTELGEEYLTSLIKDFDLPDTNNFLSEVDKLVLEAYKFPSKAVKMAVERKGKNLSVIFKSPGGEGVDFILPSNADEAFSIVNGGKSSRIKYREMPKKLNVLLTSKESFRVEFELPKEWNKDSLLHFNNRLILDHGKKKIIPLQLCTRGK